MLVNETGGLQIRGNWQSCINLRREQSWKLKAIGFREAPVTSGVTCWALPWLVGPLNFQIPCIISLNNHQNIGQLYNTMMLLLLWREISCLDYLRTSMDSDVCMRCYSHVGVIICVFMLSLGYIETWI